MSLTYQNKFWDFYTANAAEVEKILWSVSWKYKSVMETEDLKQSLIVRLERSDFLKTFDPTLAALGTYFTHKAMGYAGHLVEAELKRKGHYTLTATLDHEYEEEETVEPRTSVTVPPPVKKESKSPAKKGSPGRAGNGHKSLKVRELEAYERELITKELFIPHNGMIDSGACADFKARKLSGEVTVFQVTGVIVSLHDKVALGELALDDMVSYEEHIRGRRKLWMTYDSPRYRQMRESARKLKQETKTDIGVLWYGTLRHNTAEIPVIDEEITLEEVTTLVEKKLGLLARKILEYRLDGMEFKEIAKALRKTRKYGSITSTYVMAKCSRVKTFLRILLQK